jgi:hypothetical protein
MIALRYLRRYFRTLRKYLRTKVDTVPVVDTKVHWIHVRGRDSAGPLHGARHRLCTSSRPGIASSRRSYRNHGPYRGVDHRVRGLHVLVHAVKQICYLYF